ncbi:uncharacterized protein [Drosophila kikkawai]|uniref:Uncharacterized protein n=1 Tax=Drosophila kikkawai TaxID=30033 RepID=A0A6P4I6N4_DROKI|nr:uncharacterized protein LOC108072746 [Drosophila kikkawai]
MSDNETDSYMEEEEEAETGSARTSIPVVGPVSPNPNFQMGDYAPLFSSSISSLDGGSQESYSDSELELQQALAAELAAAEVPQSLADWRSTLRTVPATTNLTTPQARRILPMSRSPSPSSTYSASPSTSISQLIDQRSARLRRLDMLNSMIQDLQDSLPSISERRHRRNRRRRSVRFEEHDHETEQVPPNAYAEVMRRGNSISDCSQCSSAEEDGIATPIIPSHLLEWSYPGPTN